LADGGSFVIDDEPAARIAIPPDWSGLVKSDPEGALAEQIRVRGEFLSAFDDGLIGRGFIRDESEPHYSLYVA
jgi:hypothetical protein